VKNPNSFFRGSELPRLIVLLIILIGGTVLMWQYIYYKTHEFKPEPPPTVPLPPIVVDKSPEFERVTDKTALNKFRDMAAYKMLIERVENKSAAELNKISRRDVQAVQVWNHPEMYRGVPLHVYGPVWKTMTYESKYARSGRLYEAWITTPDSDRNFFICVFEDAPKGFPIGARLSDVRITFDGYFMKLMRYEAADGPRASPLLIGRVGWTPPPKNAFHPGKDPLTWMAVGVGLMFLVSLFRWMMGLRQSIAAASRSTTYAQHERPTDVIAPEDFAAWLERVPRENSEETAEHEEPAR
jgi:hypothetical protein